jgi:ubiquinone/menaquinone biosynthesis C-methylase UbiE
MNQSLLRSFLEVYPFQPATAVWRAAEVAALVRAGIPNGRGLDLGCGDGRLTRVLLEQVGNRRLVGLDVDPMETSLARDERLYEHVHTSPADAIPEPDESFDFVVSVSVMEHIPRLEPVLGEVRRVLKRGGSLITTIPSIGFHQCLRGPLLPWSTRTTYLSTIDRRLAHLRYWTVEEWRQRLEAAHLRLLEARPILSCSDVRRWETVSRFTAGLLQLVFRRKAPIEIQRSFGMRRSGQQMPSRLASILGRVLSSGLNESAPTTEDQSGCLLIVAARP